MVQQRENILYLWLILQSSKTLAAEERQELLAALQLAGQEKQESCPSGFEANLPQFLPHD